MDIIQIQLMYKISFYIKYFYQYFSKIIYFRKIFVINICNKGGVFRGTLVP